MGQSPFDFGNGAGAGPSKKPWEEFKLNPKTKIKLAFRNSNVDSILSLFQQTSKVTIIKDPTLVGGLTVTSATSVTLNQAFQILSSTLSLKGYELVKEESNLVIRKKDQGNNGRGMFGSMNFNPSMLQGMTGAQTDTRPKVYQIQFANASQVARVINDVFAQSGTGGFPNFGAMGGGGFGGGGGGFGGGRFGGGGAAQFGGANNPFAAFGRGNTQTQVRASSDDFSNSVIVNAPDSVQDQIRDLIRQIDKQTEDPQKSQVYKLQYADADDLVSVVQNVLNSNAPRGRGGATTQQTQGPQAFINAIRGSTAGSGSVSAEPRTNSLIVTATQQNLDIVAKVVKELDADVKYEPSTFVFPLSNARATDVASLLQQAFGTRSGTGTTNRNTNTNTTNRNTTNTNRNNNTRSTGLGGNVQNGEVALNDPNALALNLQDPNSDGGELATNVAVAQGFGGGFFGGTGQNRNRSTSSSQQTQGRDANGRLVNVRDLSGQVTAIPDPNTNSIIVVTTPDNAELIRNVLDQLDKIPEQVMIETIIVEATLDSTSRLGVEWKWTNEKLFNSNTTGTGQTDFGQQTTPAQTGFRYTLTGNNFNAFLNAFKSDSKFQILSTPRIFTSNNVQAEINISQSVPYVLNSRQDTNGNFTFNYSFLDVGIILTVTPRITSNGYVTMDVSQTANDLQGYTDFNAPIVNQRQADTTVSVRDGETIVLGGIIRSTVNATTRKVPLLGDLPVLGSLFKSTSKEKQKTELLVFLTPRIVRDPDEARKLRDQQQQELSPEQRRNVESLIKPNNGETTPPAKTEGGPKKSGGQ